ncbi:MAG: DMT family transporter [Deltaproteobacteria bacterium]|nr:DMT family transporter [Deltaproteobacteria bacterium]HDZ90076.1 DMT family transporter [Deltaproteobacteria bacterium]
MPEREALDLKAVVLLVVLCMLWGFNGVAIKVSNLGLAPVFNAGIRSVIAALGLGIWMKVNGMRLFPGRVTDGLVVGLLFGTEFALLFSSLLYTTVSSAWILLYSTPFFHALGAHYFLKGDRITPHKGIGLILAFSGVVLLLARHLNLPSLAQYLGDTLALGAALLWAITTIYIKRRLVGEVSHHHTLFYQTIFSIPVLFLLSLLFQETPVQYVDGLILSSVLFQGIIIAFISYLVWFYLVHAYPVSLLSAFTFLTPVFATLCGVIFLTESLTLTLVLSLILVSLGIYVVNRG